MVGEFLLEYVWWIVGVIAVCLFLFGWKKIYRWLHRNDWKLEQRYKTDDSLYGVQGQNKNKDYGYDELLQRDEWREKRKEILKRDGYRCRYCKKSGFDNVLHVHHKYYLKYPNGVKVNPWEYPDDALICLCSECHKKVHKKKKIKTYYRKYIVD